MPTGVSPAEHGGVIDPTDVRGAGPMEWAGVTGISVDHPRIGAGPRDYKIGDDWNRVVTRPYGQAGPSSDTIATPEGASTASLGHWRDVFNFHGSSAPWLLLMLIAIVYLSHLKLSAGGSAGGFGKHVRAGAALE